MIDDPMYKRQLEEYNKKKIFNDLVGITTIKPKKKLPLIKKNKKLSNSLKISKYVFQSKGLPTNMIRSKNRQKLLMASILEQNARNIKPRRPSTTSLAYLAKRKPTIKRMAIKAPARTRTYVDKTIELGKRAKA